MFRTLRKRRPLLYALGRTVRSNRPTLQYLCWFENHYNSNGGHDPIAVSVVDEDGHNVTIDIFDIPTSWQAETIQL